MFNIRNNAKILPEIRYRSNLLNKRAIYSKKQEGAALIMTLLVVAIATLLAVSLADRNQLDIRRTSIHLHNDQAIYIAKGMEAWAIGVLDDDMAETEIDHPSEAWSIAIEPEAIEGGSVQGKIIDLQGRFNLNNLVKEGKANNDQVKLFQKLLENLKLEPQLADSLIDWLDKDSEIRFPAGAEDAHYLNQVPARRTANTLLTSIRELEFIKGYDEKIVAQLAPYVCTLPGQTKINLNTAPAQILSILVPELPQQSAKSLAESIASKPISKIEDFLEIPSIKVNKNELVSAQLTSSHFMLVSEVNYGEMNRKLYSLIIRNEQGKSRVASRSFLPQEVVLTSL